MKRVCDKLKALDIDGIICPFTEEIFVPAMNEVLGTDYKMSDIDQNAWGYTDVFNITKEEEAKVWNSYFLVSYMMKAKPIQRGLELIQSYEENGFDYCFITSRASHNNNDRSKTIRSVTRQWIKEFTGSEKEVYFKRSHSKHWKALELGVNTMFEDNPETVRLLAMSGIYVFMPKYKYNEMIEESELVLPIENWM